MNRHINRIHYDTDAEQANYWWQVIGNAAAPVTYCIPQISEAEREQLNEVAKRLREFQNLNDNWDGYNSAGISALAVDEAVALLNAHAGLGGKLSLPQVYPTTNGTIAMEWQEGDGEAVVEVASTGVSGFVRPPASAATYYINGVDTQLGYQVPCLIASLMTPKTSWTGSFQDLRYDTDKSDV